MKTLPIEEVEGIDMLYKDKEALKEVQKEETKKKIINNIEDLLNM